jgi:hypothetical protein
MRAAVFVNIEVHVLRGLKRFGEADYSDAAILTVGAWVRISGRIRSASA